MREGEGTTATAQIEYITTMTHGEAPRGRHLTMINIGATGDPATGIETEIQQNTTTGKGISSTAKEIDTHTTTEAGPIPVPDPALH